MPSAASYVTYEPWRLSTRGANHRASIAPLQLCAGLTIEHDVAVLSSVGCTIEIHREALAFPIWNANSPPSVFQHTSAMNRPTETDTSVIIRCDYSVGVKGTWVPKRASE